MDSAIALLRNVFANTWDTAEKGTRKTFLNPVQVSRVDVVAWWSLFVSDGNWVAESLFQEGEIIKPKRSIKMPGSYQVNWEEELLCGREVR